LFVLKTGENLFVQKEALMKDTSNFSVVEFGSAHGRFQPLHLGHVDYLLAAAERCGFLFIGITNPDTNHTKYESAAPHRSLRFSNPLTYWERLIIVSEALHELGLAYDRFAIVPYFLDQLSLINCYIPQNTTHFTTVYDDWNREKCRRLEEQGFKVEILWERTTDERPIRGSDVRERIATGRPWEMLVPRATARVIKELAIDKRIQGLWEEFHIGERRSKQN
jgi:nicotinamide mononucleotide adenylyltransferase